MNAAQSGRCCLGGVSDARRKPSGGVDVGGAAGEGSTQQASERPEATDAAPTPTGADASTPTATAPNSPHGGSAMEKKVSYLRSWSSTAIASRSSSGHFPRRPLSGRKRWLPCRVIMLGSSHCSRDAWPKMMHHHSCKSLALSCKCPNRMPP